MDLPNLRLSYCGFCGVKAKPGNLTSESDGCIVCTGCRGVTLSELYRPGPALLVLTLVFAEQELLLLKRGKGGQWKSTPAAEGRRYSPGLPESQIEIQNDRDQWPGMHARYAEVFRLRTPAAMPARRSGSGRVQAP